MFDNLWADCLDKLKQELPAQQYNTWLRPLQGEYKDEALCLYAPNKFVLDWVSEKFVNRIEELLVDLNTSDNRIDVKLKIGSLKKAELPKDEEKDKLGLFKDLLRDESDKGCRNDVKHPKGKEPGVSDLQVCDTHHL